MAENDLFGWSGDYLLYILIGMLAFILLLFVLIIILFIRNNKLKKKYEAFMSGADGKSLEKEVMNRFEQVDVLQTQQNELEKHLREIDETLSTTYQKMGIVKYDAFQEMGGKMSFSLAMLDDVNDGFVLNSMHSRDGCYTYIKEIIKGESFVELSSEEKQALKQAKDKKNFME